LTAYDLASSFSVAPSREHSVAFSDKLGADVYFKLENRQSTGSFKFRGATNRLLTLSDEQRAQGCVAASSGNHGAAVACATQKLGVKGVIFVPEQTSSAKVDKIKSYGGDVRFFGTDGLDTEQHARSFAEQNGKFYLSPYNDEEVMAGQGSCGVEIVEDLPDVDAVFVAVGGGGLIGGIGAVLKDHDSGIRVFFPLNQAVVDDWVLATEEQIATAMSLYMECEEDVVEGAAGVAVAGLLARCNEITGKKVVVVICGGNISEETLQKARSFL
jgi:threonine dehydratase